MEMPNVNESSWRRAQRDTESFRQSASSFWGLEVFGAAVLGALGAVAGFAQTPLSPSPMTAFSYPVIGGAVGVIGGLTVAFACILGWHLFRAPYRQRNELRAFINSIPGQPSAPILADSQLFISNPSCEFGRGGEPNLGGLDSSELYGMVQALCNAQSEMTIERVALQIEGGEIAAIHWTAYEIGGGGTHLLRFTIEIEQSVATGEHRVMIVAFANGRSWRSPDFSINVPNR